MTHHARIYLPCILALLILRGAFTLAKFYLTRMLLQSICISFVEGKAEDPNVLDVQSRIGGNVI